MGKDSELFFPLSKGEVSSIVVHVGCFVAITLSNFQEFLKSFDWSRSVRVSSICLAVIPFWVDFQEAEKVSHHFFATFFYFCFKVNCCHAFLHYFDLNWTLQNPISDYLPACQRILENRTCIVRDEDHPVLSVVISVFRWFRLLASGS